MLLKIFVFLFSFSFLNCAEKKEINENSNQTFIKIRIVIKRDQKCIYPEMLKCDCKYHILNYKLPINIDDSFVQIKEKLLDMCRNFESKYSHAHESFTIYLNFIDERFSLTNTNDEISENTKIKDFPDHIFLNLDKIKNEKFFEDKSFQLNVTARFTYDFNEEDEADLLNGAVF